LLFQGRRQIHQRGDARGRGLAQLPADRFRQIHRGTVVNMAEVAAARRDDAGRLQLVLRGRKETLPVSRLYADLFRQM
jgi:DNA-binding LytR/AlgR family response regulator